MPKPLAEKVYEDVRDYLDNKVAALSPEQYLDFLDLLIGDLESRKETTENEIEEAEESDE